MSNANFAVPRNSTLHRFVFFSPLSTIKVSEHPPPTSVLLGRLFRLQSSLAATKLLRMTLEQSICCVLVFPLAVFAGVHLIVVGGVEWCGPGAGNRKDPSPLLLVDPRRRGEVVRLCAWWI